MPEIDRDSIEVTKTAIGSPALYESAVSDEYASGFSSEARTLPLSIANICYILYINSSFYCGEVAKRVVGSTCIIIFDKQMKIGSKTVGGRKTVGL